MANNIVTQVALEVLIVPIPKARTTQEAIEVLVNPNILPTATFKPKVMVI